MKPTSSDMTKPTSTMHTTTTAVQSKTCSLREHDQRDWMNIICATCWQRSPAAEEIVQARHLADSYL